MASQREYWNKEHADPSIHPAMDKDEPSAAVLWLLERLEEMGMDLDELQGLEMGCGKGRNTLALAEKKLKMHAFDFSPIAIDEAKRRAETKKLTVDWATADATKEWPYSDASIDIGIDCYASSDIDTLDGRTAARDEWKRVLVPQGVLLVAAISSNSAFHAEMLAKHPGDEDGSFRHPSGKFEKTFTEEELWEFYGDFAILSSKTHHGEAIFSGKTYKTESFWLLLGT